MTFYLIRRLAISRNMIAMLLVFLTSALRVSAEGQFSGEWIVSETPHGPPILTLNLFDTGSSISGNGQVLDAALGPFDNTTFDIDQGFSDQTGVQITIRLASMTSPPETGRALLVLTGGNGRALPGTLFWGKRGTRVFLRASDSSAISTTTQPRACKELDEVTARISRKAGSTTQIISEIRGVYANFGLAFAGTETGARCKDAMAELARIEQRLDSLNAKSQAAIGQNSRPCVAMNSSLDAIGEALVRENMSETGTVAVIMQKYGLPGGGAAGTYSQQACRAADLELQDYLNELSQGVLAHVDTNRDSPKVQSDFQYNPIEFVSGRGWVPGNGGTKLSYWQHNNSGVAWESGPSNQRYIWYWSPRSGLESVGIENKVLLFRGNRRGNSIVGEARIFTQACGTFPYQVSGHIEANNLKVTLHGDRPVVNASCEIVGSKADTLIFTYQSNTPPSVARTAPAHLEPDERDMPGIGVWGPAYRLHQLPSGETLNVRHGPGTSFKVLSKLPYNARDVLIVDEGCRPNPDTASFEKLSASEKARAISKSWCKVNWSGVEGWVYGKYLTPQ